MITRIMQNRIRNSYDVHSLKSENLQSTKCFRHATIHCTRMYINCLKNHVFINSSVKQKERSIIYSKNRCNEIKVAKMNWKNGEKNIILNHFRNLILILLLLQIRNS